MLNYMVKDKADKEAILRTELVHSDVNEMIQVFISTCRRDGVVAHANDFADFLLEQGIIAELIVLENDILLCDKIHDMII